MNKILPYAPAIKLLDHNQFEHQISQMPMFEGTAALVTWAVAKNWHRQLKQYCTHII